MKNNSLNKKPIVSIVVVTWNSEEDIVACLESLIKQDYENINEIIVVDSASEDQTVKKIEEFKTEHKNIKLILSKKNLYFTGGYNLGIKEALKQNPDFVAIINPDTVASKDWISQSVSVTNLDETVGIVAPKIKFLDSGLINSAGLVFDGFMQAYDNGFEERDDGQFDYIKAVEAVSGTAMLLNVGMIKDVGFFWKRLKMYLEDLEYCLRARKKDWKIYFTGETEILHSYNASTSQNTELKLDRLKRKNWLWIALRHYSWKSKLAMAWRYFFSRGD